MTVPDGFFPICLHPFMTSPRFCRPQTARTGEMTGFCRPFRMTGRKAYKMRPIIEAIVDHGTFFEMGRFYGRSIITGLARIDGRPVALMAGDSQHYAGAWDVGDLSEGRPFRRPGTNVPPACRLSARLPGLYDRLGGGEGGDHSARCAGHGRGEPGDGALVHDYCAQCCGVLPRSFISLQADWRCDMPGRRAFGDHCPWKAA